MPFSRSLHLLCVAVVILTCDGTAAMKPAESQDLSWPAAFGESFSGPSEWVTRQVDAGTLRLRVPLPPQWKVTSGSSGGDMLFTAQDAATAMRMDVEPMTPSGFELSQPLPNASVQASMGSIQANVASRGHEIVGARQVRSGNRLWIWHESRMKSAAFETGPYGSGRAWIFTGTPQSHRMTI